jgi:hypothetical protein
MTVFTFSDSLTYTRTSAQLREIEEAQLGDVAEHTDVLNTYITLARSRADSLPSAFGDNLDRGTEQGAGAASIFNRVLQDAGYAFTHDEVVRVIPRFAGSRTAVHVQVLTESLSATVSAGDGWVRLTATQETWDNVTE